MSLKTQCIIAGILLLLAIPPAWPYSFYILLRIIIFVTSILVAWGFYKSNLSAWVWIFGAIAVMFNPIFPIYMNKASWVPIDFISAILFFIAGYSSKGKN
ncbi:MAG: hypothetical protein Q7K55_02545 [Candidatus Levybacteria bacterium]|nr:hypothetical protein [Candidatus Levybacteria bacterium]